MKIYDLKKLQYEARPGTKIHVKYISLHKPEENFDGKSKIISNNMACCIASNSNHTHFCIFFDECSNNEASARIGDNITEFYNLTPNKKEVKSIFHYGNNK